MKKPIGKRITGFLAAAALAVTTIGASFVKPITAKAANYRNVLVTVYDADGSQAALQNSTGSKYYVLAMLTDKGVEPTRADDGSWKNVKAWSLKQFAPDQLEYDKQIGMDPNDHYAVTSTDLIEFNQPTDFWAYGTDGSTKTSNVIYNSNQYDFTARIYRSLDWNSSLSTLADCVDHTKAADTIPGYKFGSDDSHYTNWTNGDTDKIAITKFTATYEVDLQADAATDFTEADNLYLRVEVSHGSGNSSYFVKKLTAADIQAGKIVIQTEDSAKWISQGGQDKPNERISGDEQSITARLVKASGTPKINDITEKNNLSILESGDIVKGFEVTNQKRDDNFDKTTNERTIVDKISLTQVTATDDYNFKSVLGNGLFFGITADRYQQANHAQTNFAANYYQSAGNIDQDLSGDFGGHIYVANFVDFNNGTTVAGASKKGVDKNDERATIELGQSHLDKGTVLHVDSYDRLRTQRDYVAVVIDTPANMTNNVIEPIIGQMKATSAALLNHAPLVTPQKVSSNEYIIDATNYGSNTTVYVDGDTVSDLLGGTIDGKFTIKAKKDQTIVFNFDETEKVTIGRIRLQVYDDDGNIIDESKNHDVSSQVNANKGDDTNQWLDEYVTRQLIWNLNSATDITFDGTAGVFLIPKEDSVANVAGTSSGWLITDGYVINTSGEWHYLYSDLPTSTAEINISKSDITGENEVEGAVLEIKNANGGTVQKWTSEKDKNGNTNRTFILAPGTYTLTETGFESENDGGKEYKIIDSVVTFTVVETKTTAKVYDFDKNEYVDKEITSATVVIDENSKNNKAAFTEDTDNGYFTKVNANTIRVNDAEKTADDSLSVKVSKVDIADGNEVAGAKLQILDAAGQTVKSWTSTTKPYEINGLEAGVTYTLRETVAPDGYLVATDITFTLDAQGKVTTTAKTTTDGVILVEDTMTKVSVSKVDIANGEELEGATIQILDENEKVVEEWVSTNKAHEITGLKTETTYTLRETVAPDGYLVATDTTFTIATDGKVTSTGSVTEDDVLLVEDTMTKVSVSKVDIANGEELEGATIQILDEDGKTVDEWVSTNKAHEITGLKTGVTYTLRETVAPEGYAVATDTTFTIDEKGKVTSTGSVTEGGVLLVEDNMTSVKISKVDITDEKEVAGATLQILEGKTVVKEWKSGTTAQEITGLKTGVTYTLRETVAPEGYTVATDTTFTIGTDGKVTTTAKTTTDGTILVEDSKTSVKVSKVDIADGKEVEGAHIQVLEGTTVVDEWDSTKTAHEIIGLKTGVTYTLRETVAPEGYNVATDTDFTIGANGKVASKTTKINADGVLLVEDSATSDTVVTVSKKEINGKDELAGAKLTIKDSEGKVVKTWTSGNVAEKVALKDGTYTLEETGDEFTIGNKTYKVTDSTVEFTVKNGEVTSYKVTEGTIGKITVDGTNITVEDAFEEKVSKDTDVTISKKEINGKDELEGATLTIKDSEGNVVKTWTSGKTAVTVTLKDGTYTLEETGDGFTVGDKTYKVTDSTVEFTVKNGEVTSYKVTEGTIGKITVEGTHITVEDVYEEKQSEDEEKKDDEEQQSDEEEKTDEEQKSDEEEKTDEEQQSEDEEKTDEDSQSEDEEKTDEDSQSEDEEKDDEEEEEDKKSDDKKSDSDSDSDSESQDDEDTGSGDADTNDSSTSDGNDNDGDQTGSGGATTTTTNATTGNGGAFPVALAFACLATVIFKKKNED